MIVRIFSSFDIRIYNSFAYNYSYVYGLIPIIINLQLLWIEKPTSKFFFLSYLEKTLFSLNTIRKRNNIKSSHNIFVAVFYALIILNIVGIFPYILAFTSHLEITLSLGLPLWFIILIGAFIKTTKFIISHQVVEGAPLYIGPFLALAEIIRNIIRPITLSFRLSANIRAGHVILGILNSALVTIVIWKIFKLSVSGVIVGYSLFELVICFVQAFVFILLLYLYTNDYVAIK